VLHARKNVVGKRGAQLDIHRPAGVGVKIIGHGDVGFIVFASGSHCVIIPAFPELGGYRNAQYLSLDSSMMRKSTVPGTDRPDMNRTAIDFE
jgi:hypothetical protein